VSGEREVVSGTKEYKDIPRCIDRIPLPHRDLLLYVVCHKGVFFYDKHKKIGNPVFSGSPDSGAGPIPFIQDRCA
jgi:hypothetical protein